MVGDNHCLIRPKVKKTQTQDTDVSMQAENEGCRKTAVFVRTTTAALFCLHVTTVRSSQ